uniref:RNA-directed RNA polymerase n=1 Tax=Grapevine-associated tombus-like virus 2 TaxID=2814342 RepID=A0A8F5RCV4_9TOMB|nr:MAG: RNA-dependent RNA polymerase [Grapevine-associated tombus-like virus 2]
MNLGLDHLHQQIYRPKIPHGGNQDEQVAFWYRIDRYDPEIALDVKSPEYKLCRYYARKLGRRLSTMWEPISLEQVLDHYSGKLRERYRLAVESLKTSTLTRRDASIKEFVKRDKVSPLKFQVKAPRIISPRETRYGVTLAKYTKPIEAAFFKLKDHYNIRYFAKGCDARQRYRIIREKFEAIEDCVIMTIDAEAFDAHVNTFQLRLEHMVYTVGCNRTELRQILSWQLKNIFKGTFGLRRIVKARRMSGDMNTALGNCVIVYIIIKAFMKHYKLRKLMAIFDDGDDCLLFVSRSVAELVRRELPVWFKNIGHVLKIENYVDRFQDIVFCQARPFETRQIMVRNWTKVLSHCYVSNKHYDHPKFGVKIMKSIALAEVSLNPGVPIIGPWFAAWLEKLVDVSLAPDEFLEESIKRRVSKNWSKATYIPPTHADRACFSDLFGITATEQIALEMRLVDYVMTYPLEEYLAIDVLGDQHVYFPVDINLSGEL